MQLSSGTLNKNAKREYSAYPKKARSIEKIEKMDIFAHTIVLIVVKRFVNLKQRKTESL